MRRLLAGAGLVVLGMAGVLVALYVTNATPVVARIEKSALDGRPFVVKLHAQWCPVCRVTKDVWIDIEAAYADQVNLVVLDFTNEATTHTSRADAERVGLTSLFDEYHGATGYIVIADGRTKEVLQEIKGSRDFSEYQVAIDDALKRSAHLQK
jgi:thiol-disulfide isomerase/thioredoxin